VPFTSTLDGFLDGGPSAETQVPYNRYGLCLLIIHQFHSHGFFGITSGSFKRISLFVPGSHVVTGGESECHKNA